MKIIPEHPGVELKHLLQEKNLNISQFARTIGVSASRISEILSGKRRVTLDSAFKFSEAFNHTPEHWIRKQEDYDIFIKNILNNKKEEHLFSRCSSSYGDENFDAAKFSS